MPVHNGVMYNMASSETEAFSHHYGGSIAAGSTFPEQSSALPFSLQQTVSRGITTASHPAKLNCCAAATIQSASVGQKQLPDKVAGIAQTPSSRTNAAQWSSSITSHSPSSTIEHVSMDTVLSTSVTCSAVTQEAAETAAVNVACDQPISSSSVEYSEECAAENADEKCSEVNSASGHCSPVKNGVMSNQPLDRIDNTLTASAVKVEPKIEMETNSDDISESTACQRAMTNAKVDVKSEQLKCEIKSKLASEENEETIDRKDPLLIKHSDVAAVKEPASGADLIKQSSRKGIY